MERESDPCWFSAFSVIVYDPGELNVYDGEAEELEPPSPKFQAYVTGESPVTVAVNRTWVRVSGFMLLARRLITSAGTGGSDTTTVADSVSVDFPFRFVAVAVTL